ncbi:MAG: hypothetical protein DMD67_03140 [Gemmatimonadetes bacterium]|nr:MAG: hypothetical protein DMD67_03140 [Gemmatimonadota bacterium]
MSTAPCTRGLRTRRSSSTRRSCFSRHSRNHPSRSRYRSPSRSAASKPSSCRARFPRAFRRSTCNSTSTQDAVYAEAVVEERPALLSAPPAPYPDLLKQAGIQGRVLLRAIVDTTGHAEPNSVEIISSPNPGFDVPARMWVLRAVFRPARLHGQAVRVHITLPIDYSLRQG